MIFCHPVSDCGGHGKVNIGIIDDEMEIRTYNVGIWRVGLDEHGLNSPDSPRREAPCPALIASYLLERTVK